MRPFSANETQTYEIEEMNMVFGQQPKWIGEGESESCMHMERVQYEIAFCTFARIPKRDKWNGDGG